MSVVEIHSGLGPQGRSGEGGYYGQNSSSPRCESFGFCMFVVENFGMDLVRLCLSVHGARDGFDVDVN